MNKFLRVTAVMAATIAFFSCNNGAYDARPDKNEGKNPLNPNSGVTVPLGTIKAVIEGVTYLFNNGYYLDTSFYEGRKPAFYCGASRQDKLANDPMIAIQFNHAEEARPDATEKTSGHVIYSYIHPKLKERIYYLSLGDFGSPDMDTAKAKELYGMGTLATPASIKGIEDGNIYGTLATGNYYLMPSMADKDGKIVKPPVEDTVINVSGEFNLPNIRDMK